MATSTKKKNTTHVLGDAVAVDEKPSKLDLTNVTDGPVRIDDNAIINVKSNTFGKLIYVDPHTGEMVVWPSCGTVQQLTYGMLRSMKAGCLGFFKNQWIIMTGFADENADKYMTADIYNGLMVTHYYENLVDPSDYDEICSWDVDEIKDRVQMMTEGARTNLVVALNTFIANGVLDSIKKIKAFEEALGCALMDVE